MSVKAVLHLWKLHSELCLHRVQTTLKPCFHALVWKSVPVLPVWNMCLCPRSVTVCWSCSSATLGTGFTVLASLGSEGCWWPSAPSSWPYLTSSPSPTNTTPFYTVRPRPEREALQLLCLCLPSTAVTAKVTQSRGLANVQICQCNLCFPPPGRCSIVSAKATRACCSALCSAANDAFREPFRCSPAELLHKWEGNS